MNPTGQSESESDNSENQDEKSESSLQGGLVDNLLQVESQDNTFEEDKAQNNSSKVVHGSTPKVDTSRKRSWEAIEATEHGYYVLSC